MQADLLGQVAEDRAAGLLRRRGGTAIVGIPYALVALSAPAILGDQLPESAVLFTLLEQYAPAFLTILVLSAIVAASCSTANGAILGTAAVAVRNIAGLEQQTDGEGRDPLLRRVRITMIPVVAVAIFFALQVPQTGILLTLAFDLMLAGLVVPFVLGHYWSRITTAAAIAAIASGVVVRLVLFALTPTMYGVENTLLYIPNDTFGRPASTDGRRSSHRSCRCSPSWPWRSSRRDAPRPRSRREAPPVAATEA